MKGYTAKRRPEPAEGEVVLLVQPRTKVPSLLAFHGAGGWTLWFPNLRMFGARYRRWSDLLATHEVAGLATEDQMDAMHLPAEIRPSR